MNIVDIHKDWSTSRRNVTAEAPLSMRPQKPPRPQSPHKSTTADAGLPVPAPLVTHASSSDNIRGTLISRTPTPKALGQPCHKDPLNFVQPAPTPPHTEITLSLQPASESEYSTTDDEYHVLNKDDIPKLVSEFDQKPDGWPKQASNVRWISEDQKTVLVPSGLVTAPPIGAFPSPQIQHSSFSRFFSRLAKEQKQPPIDVANQMVLSKPQTTVGQTNNQIPELEDKSKPLKSEAKVQTVLGQSGGPVAVLGLGSMFSG